MPYL
jgi:hypothetical protein